MIKAVAEAVFLSEVLPDALGRQSPGHRRLDNFPIGLGGALGSGDALGVPVDFQSHERLR